MEQRIDLVLLERQLLDAIVRGDLRRARAAVPFELPATFSDEAIEHFTMRRDQLAADPSWQPWLIRAIVLQDEQCMVGYANFHGPPGVNDTSAPDAVSIGYTIFPEFRGRGLASQTARMLVEWARREHDIKHFVCGVLPDNAASQRVLEKLGFHRTSLIVDGEVIFELRFPA